MWLTVRFCEYNKMWFQKIQFFLTAQQQLAPQDNRVRPNYISKVKS